jgi:hypothetical protein
MLILSYAFLKTIGFGLKFLKEKKFINPIQVGG